jgi:outer membrane receptor protein involved in Fe transport
VTGLSIVGSGFVYVRGLGDRYSLALLNGSPLPSPEPLRRVVPLDIFPTNIVSSSLVQKSYSANFPGEFGGGVVNLTTTSVPKEPFFSISTSISGDTETTGQLGYSYFGAKSDWTGFDNGSRNTPPALQDFFSSGKTIDDASVDQQAILGQLVRFSRATLQKQGNLPANFSVSLSGGKAFDIADDITLGVIATAGFSNRWSNRDSRQQVSSSLDLSQIESDFNRVITDNRVVANALFGLGLEAGEHKFRFTNLYIRDTVKQGRLASGTEVQTGFSRINQDTAWFERQLMESQFVGEWRFDKFTLDVRGTYANSQREAPYETSFGYVKTNRANDPFGNVYVNRLNNGQSGSASVAFSDLNEDLWFTSTDLGYAFTNNIRVSAGYAFNSTVRTSSRREFLIIAPSDFNLSTTSAGVATLRPDLLLSPDIVNFYNIGLVESTQGDPAFRASLRTHAGYAKAIIEVIDGLSLDAGVRYEKATQRVVPLQLFNTPTNSGASTVLKNREWLPAATVTWKFAPKMQLRFNASRTLARPQFRELMFQQYYDPESDRLYRGNPLLKDGRLTNGEARFEWYYDREQSISLAGFYKKIDDPIEAYVSFTGNSQETSYANAPRATLYGMELDATKYFDLSSLGSGFESRRLVLIGNYTYTRSKISVSAGDTVPVFLGRVSEQPATNFFTDGSRLTGQSDHIANVQVGIEDTDKLSQQTLLLSYASTRVVSRGAAGQPDILEKPGFKLDLVMRETLSLLGKDFDLKFEARNLTGTSRQEFQKSATNRIEINSYDVGRSFSLGVSVKF